MSKRKDCVIPTKIKSSEKRILIPLRLYESDKNLLDKKVVEDKISMQKVIEVLVCQYLKDNKAIKEIIKEYTDQKYARKEATEFSEYEEDDLLRKIERLSPLK